MLATKENAYAKINLHLDVVNRRLDGFHNIKSIMQTVSLCDEVEVTIIQDNKSTISVETDGEFAQNLNEKSIICKAARAFMDKCGYTDSVLIHLVENIPSEAGLGGASADAAAALRALSRLYDHPLNNNEMISICTQIGSDVPFCYLGGTAICEGKGEIITPIDATRKFIYVIAKGKKGMSTPEAYATLDAYYDNFSGRKPTGGESKFEMILKTIKSMDAPSVDLFNIFESVVSANVIDISAIKNILAECGSTAAMMTGSGTAVFGIFDSRSDAEKAEYSLKQNGYFAKTAESVLHI